MHLSSNGDLDLNTSLDVDDDLLDDLSGGVKAESSVSTHSSRLYYPSPKLGWYILNQTLVDAHLKGIPGLGTLTVRSLTGGDLENLGRKADGALDAEILGASALDELLADLLERLDLAGSQGDADLVLLLRGC